MKDKFDNLESKETKDAKCSNVLNVDDDYIFTEDQRQAALELQSLYRQLGLEDFDDGYDGSYSVCSNEESQLDIEEKLRDINAQFTDDETPLESDRPRKVHFKESVVDLVVPISPLLRNKSLSPYYDFEDIVSSSEDEDETTPNVEEESTECELNGNPCIVNDPVLLKESVLNNNAKNIREDSVSIPKTVDIEDVQKIEVLKSSPSVVTTNEQNLENQKIEKQNPQNNISNRGIKHQNALSKQNGHHGSLGRASQKTVISETREKFMPTYKGNARSPYGIPDEERKELKRVRQAEVQQKRQKELSSVDIKLKRREEAEKAYRAWLEIKLMQIGRTASASPSRKGLSSPRKRSTVKKEENTEEALRLWLEQKTYQENKERIVRHLVQQEKTMMLQRSKREDSRKAYTAWLKKKKDERQQFHRVQNERSGQQVEMLRKTFEAYFGSYFLPKFI